MKKILVIEDNLEVRENLAEILELSGYEVATAENGKIGVQEARSVKPDLILCDVMMPELDGFGVLRILDQNPKTADIPFVFLTAKAEKDDFRKGMNLGADDYITKPFDDVELLDAIEMRLKKSERIKKSFDGTAQGLTSFISEARGQRELNKLSEDREIQRFRKKDFVYEEGQYAKRLYFIASGKVKTFKTNDVGKEYIIKIHKAGEFLGYQALIKEDKYHESASALEETELSLIPKEDFFALLYNNRDFSARFIKMLADNMEDQEEQLLSLAYNSIRKRVAESLLVLQERFAKDGISILRDDLASMVGTAKESVIRTLTDFKNEGLIKIESGSISILATDKLAAMPN
ncbi:MAG: response regulator [Saprospiraceae bacterium]|nr:response regulator [Saprospiraceae bacterium]